MLAGRSRECPLLCTPKTEALRIIQIIW